MLNLRKHATKLPMNTIILRSLQFTKCKSNGKIEQICSSGKVPTENNNNLESISSLKGLTSMLVLLLDGVQDSN